MGISTTWTALVLLHSVSTVSSSVADVTLCALRRQEAATYQLTASLHDSQPLCLLPAFGDTAGGSRWESRLR